MTRTPLLLGLLAVFTLASITLSACQSKQPTVNEATPESQSQFEMVNGVLMRVNKLPTGEHAASKAEFEKIRQDIHKRVIDQSPENRHD